jgi:hypothetical protein
MKPSLSGTPSVLHRLAGAWRQVLFGAAVCAALLPGCGGGVGTGGTGSFSTSYSSGTITGFGSVIVNGVRFDDTAAVVEDNDGTRRTRDDLKLGMTVDIDSGPITRAAAGDSASATRILVNSELRGPVGSVNVPGNSLTVMGQRVSVDVTTVFDDNLVGGLAGLTPGALVQVYAVFDPALASYRASRIEPASASADWHLRGPLAAAADTVAVTLIVGSTTYSYAGASGVPASLAAGQFVRLTLVAGTAAGSFRVTRFGTALQAVADVDEVELKGLISSFTSINSFSVNGRPVDASATTTFTPANGAGLVLGARVKVEGTLRSGTLRAREVDLVTDQEERDRGFELRGSIASVNTGASTFVLGPRNLTVSYARPGLVFKDGNAGNLVVNARIKVKGQLSTDGSRVEATEIEFDD